MQHNPTVKIIDPSRDERWDNFVLQQKYATIYHHSAWKELLEHSFKHMRSIYFTLEDEGNNIVGGIPVFLVKSWLTGSRLVSVPFASVCKPLVSELKDLETLSQAIIDRLSEYGCSYVEFRTRDDPPFLDVNKFEKLCQFKGHVLELNKDLDTLMKSFHKTSIQQRIRRAEREGLKARLASSENDLRVYYRLLTVLRLKKMGLPPPPYRLFKNMWELLRPKNMMALHLIEDEGNVIAGMLVLKFNQTAISEHSASRDQYLKKSCDQYLWWKAIESSQKEGYQFFDFGKVSTNNEGLLEFKRRWQAREYNLYSWFFPEAKGVYSSNKESLKYRLMSAAWRKMPVPMARIGGHFLYKHLG
jgi:hypothetical protein